MENHVEICGSPFFYDEIRHIHAEIVQYTKAGKSYH